MKSKIITSILLLSMFLSINAMAKNQSKEDVIIKKMRTEINALENKDDAKKHVNVAIKRLSSLRKKYASSMQFVKSKNIKSMISELKKNGANAKFTAVVVEKPKEKKKKYSHWRKIFSEGLTDSNGNRVSVKSLNGKYVGIYFSAHWCPPCRAFTPKLVKFRNKNASKFEVVFVSSDRSLKDQQSYMKGKGMKWGAVKYKGKNRDDLTSKYSVTGIPKLVILDPNNNLITEKGWGEVSNDPLNCLAKWQK